jgi:hypothetical protein
MESNRLGDKKGTNLSNVVRFNEAMKTFLKIQKTWENIQSFSHVNCLRTIDMFIFDFPNVTLKTAYFYWNFWMLYINAVTV